MHEPADVVDEYRLLRAAEDAAVEPWALLKAVRDPGGRVVDFTYHDLNAVAVRQQRLRREDVLGRSVSESLPEVVRSGILDSYIRCIDTGEPLIMDDLAYYGRTLHAPEPQTRRYDVRAVRVETEYLSLHWRDVDERYRTRQHVAESEDRYRLLAEQLETARRLLAASADSMLDPQALLEAVRDPAGEVIDFRYLDVNAAACSYLGLQKSDLVGHAQLEASPNLEGSELHQRYIRCLVDGEPVIIDDYPFFNEIIDDDRRYDIRATRVAADLLSLTWSDVTERFATAQRLQAATAVLRATVDSMLDPQMLLEAVRDPAGRVVDLRYREANEAACKDMATTRDDLVGRTVLELLPGFAESGPLAYYIERLESGQPGALDDYSYDHEIQADSRHYDIRIAPAGKDLISLTFRDVTDRFQAAQRALAAQTLLRATVDSMLDPQMLLEAVRDPAGRVVDFLYRAANLAFCSYRGWEERDILGKSLLQAQPGVLSTGLFGRYVNCVDTGEAVVLDDFEMFNSMLGEDRRFDIRVVRAGVDLISLTFSDVTDRFLAAAAIATSEHNYRLLAENAGDLVVLIRDRRFVWVSPSFTDVLGGTPDYWVGHDATEIVLPEEDELITDSTEVVESGGVVQMRHRVQALDGTIHWVDVHAKPFYAPDGQEDGITAAMRVIDDEVAAERRLAEARREKQRDDERYRRSIDNAAVGMCMVTLDGHLYDINEAGCRFFGYDARELNGMGWQEVTAPEYLEEEQGNWNAIMEGRIESYRMVKHYRHAQGHLIWGDLSVSGVRDQNGTLEHVVALITDVTAEIQARERLVASEERNRALAQGLQSELSSAAKYLQSILPGDMAGHVAVSTRYLPSRTLGGDSFDFRWIDDDHMVVYLLDVSGHGVESALIAVSVHNMLRSASFSTGTLVEPARVLATLNQQFGMDQHDDNYFTIFYGVYQRSSATVRYVSAGHPPALLLKGGQVTELSSQSLPIGMFDDADFRTTTVPIPPGTQMLLYSDGAYELPLDDGGQWPLRAFVDMCTRLAESPDWTLDDVIDNALDHSAGGSFTDDCCLVRITFD